VTLAIGIVAVMLLAGAGLARFLAHWTYSDGQRAGYVQVLSHRGWPCGTWEGELAMTTQPGMISERFKFTVPSNALAAHVKRVGLHYEKHKWVPNSCFGEPQYSS
jgi:hypothetical protein